MQSVDVVIVGAGGKVAAACAQLFLQQTDWSLALLSSREIDPTLVDPMRVQRLSVSALDFSAVREACVNLRPKVIINAAAMTNVDACESDKQLAQNLNVKAVENIVRACRIVGAHLIHYSTDYIFDGKKGPYTEDDTPHPLNYYGKTKLGGENAILSSDISATILRTNIVYGRAPGVKTDFVTWVRDKCRAGERITIAQDQWGNPTLCDDLALATMRVIEKGRTGVYNIAGADYLDRYDFALRIAEFFGLPTDTVVPVQTVELTLAARRPLRAGLITLKAETDLAMKPTTIAQGLMVYPRESVVAKHTPKRQGV